MFGIGGFELFLIVLFAFMLFGPEKIPVFLKTLRKALAKFREAEQEVSAALKQEVIDPDTGETAADVLDELTGKSTGSAAQRSASGESFAERKARHEREKAEREKRERERAEREEAAKAAAREEAAGEAEREEAAGEAAPAVEAIAAAPSVETAEEALGDAASEPAAAPTIAGVPIDELYSMKPVGPAAVASEGADAGKEA